MLLFTENFATHPITMAWTEITRADYERRCARCASTDGGRDRQPIGQDHGKRRNSWLRRGNNGRKRHIVRRLCRTETEEGAAKDRHFTLEIVKRTDKAKVFELLPRRWVVERTFA